jgi:AraC family transcriptional regulator of arabinose operon
MVELFDLRHYCAEAAGFQLERPKGHPAHTFLHFVTPVDILIDGKMVHTEPHACIFYHADTPQKFYSADSLINDYIHFGSGVEDTFQEYGIQFDTLYYPINYNICSSIIQEMEQIFFSDRSLRDQLLNVKFNELLIRFAQSLQNDPQPHIDKDTRSAFINFRLYLLTQLDKPWTVKRMADGIGISQSRFYALYKDIFGCSPTTDLIRSRIDRAKRMLALSNDSISNIATQLGYSNVSHFMRQFKAIVGVAPGQYRKSKEQYAFRQQTPLDSAYAFSLVTDILTNNRRHQQDYPEIRTIIPQNQKKA